MHRAHWIKDRPILHLIPHWNWAGKEGQPIRVMALTNAGTVELFLNGRSLGEKAVDPYDFASWDVPYETGKLEAVAKNAGAEVGRDSVETTGPAAAIRLVPDRTTLRGDGRDALPVTVEAVDSAGRVVPTSGPQVVFSCEGPADIIGVGNGDPNCHEPEKSDRHSLFNGLGQVILRSRSGDPRPISLKARAEGLQPAEIGIGVEAVEPIPRVEAVAPSFTVAKWLMSPVTADRADPGQKPEANDQNSWQSINPAHPPKPKSGGWVIFRSAPFSPYAAQRKQGGIIDFGSIGGKAEVWLDGTKVAEKSDPRPARLSAPLPPGEPPRVLVVVAEGAGTEPVGPCAIVKILPKP